MFNLEAAIAAWRRTLEHQRVFRRTDLDELEAHVRDHVEALGAEGWSEEAAFQQAMVEVGDYGTTEMEYRKVFWAKLKHQRALWRAALWEFAMLRNYITITLRNLRKRKGYAFINIFGLAAGLACCMLIALYIQDELIYDRYHEKVDRIYRMYVGWGEDGTAYGAATPLPLGPALHEDFPEIERYTRVHRESFLMQRGERAFQEEEVFLADSTVFEVFTYPMLRGNPATALEAPFSIVLTESLAQKYFDDENPVGQTMRIDDSHTFTVTGVIEDVPETSHFSFQALISMATGVPLFGDDWGRDWFWTSWHTYVLLPEGYDPDVLQAKLPDFTERHAGEAMRNLDLYYTLYLQPLADAHLSADMRYTLEAPGNPDNLYIFAAIAVFILLIAAINFMNLSTARSAERAREVGVRKAVGAARGQLALQFLGESVVLSLFAFVLALGLAFVLLPVFESLTAKTLVLAGNQYSVLGMGAFAVALIVGVLAGLYPALIISKFRPVHVLKGTFVRSNQGLLLRKSLVVTQFSISIALIACTLLVLNQVAHMRSQTLGFVQDEMLVIHFSMDEAVQGQNEVIRQAMLRNPAVVRAGFSSDVPSTQRYSAYSLMEDPEGEMQVRPMALYQVDFDFVSTFGIEMVAGRSFSRDFPTDSSEALVINEAAARYIGYPNVEEAVGKRFSQWGREGRIVGVMHDFNFRSLRSSVTPLSLRLNLARTQFLTLRLETPDLVSTMAEIEATWQALVPHRPLTYTFMDSRLSEQYRAEERFGILFQGFASLAILIACLGLFGLATFTIQQRTKEIGVRKVLGATVPQVMVLLARDFVVLVIIAFVVATPIAYYLMGNWLQAFAYRIDIGASTFLLAGVVACAIAVGTISYQAIRAATANPVKALRYE